MDLYSEDYFERGPEKGLSLYAQYSWRPELTLPMCHYVIQHMGLRSGDTLLDVGCAKGYVVRGLHLLGVDAYGCDISKYAIESADSDTRKHLIHMRDPFDRAPYEKEYSWILSKDTLEHLTDDALAFFMRESARCARQALHIIPLGDEGKYVIPEYHKDKTHIQIHSATWWIERFEEAGWTLRSFSYQLKGIKENWTKPHPKGNGFFILER